MSPNCCLAKKSASFNDVFQDVQRLEKHFRGLFGDTMGECWESFDISLTCVLAQDTLTDASASQFRVKLVFKVPYSAHFDFSVLIFI